MQNQDTVWYRYHFCKKKKRLIAYAVECKLEKRLRKLATNSVYLREEGD